ncbi:MAG: diaminopimelate decarboxylase [Candidatus Diapherotrites archaeon]|nr:diaminopimelate decarboxylase [Candidatus Diapherotrites archaeon]
MEHLDVLENRLKICGFDVAELAEKYGTPLYIYNLDRIVENYELLKSSFENEGINVKIHYAMKANSNPEILKELRKLESCLDCVSPNEVKLAIKCGFKSKDILFTGTSVSDEDLKILTEEEILINVDSLSQIKRLAKINPKRKEISIRINPQIGAGIHEHTITAGKYVKFGIPEENVIEAAKLANGFGFKIKGIHEHIGSGWLGNDVKNFLTTANKLIEIYKKISSFLGYELEFIDFGGGPGIPYRENDEEFPIKQYSAGISEIVRKEDINADVFIEPGRFIVGDAGILVCKINTVEDKYVPIIGVDAGFNCLIRPAFYGAYHRIILCENVESKNTKDYLIAGNLCESGDVFNENREILRKLPIAEEGQHIALLDAGAYGFTMASNYNLRTKPAEIIIKERNIKLVRRKENLEDMLTTLEEKL